MRFKLLHLLVLSAALVLASVAIAQTASKPAQRPAPWKAYCQPNGGFCFKYPGSWIMLSEVYGGNGVVVAPQQRQERPLWDAVTVALVVPASQAGDAMNLDKVIDSAVSSVRESGQNFETLQRQRRRVNDNPAQLVKLRYTDKSNSREWIEEVVFIQGPDSEIYSVALKCAPASLASLQPLFSRIVDSWKLPEAQPTPGDEKPPAQPKS